MDNESLQNTNNKPMSAYRMIILLPLGVATYRWYPLPHRNATWYSANNSEAVRDGQVLSTAHQNQLKVSRPNGNTTSARRCHPSAISASGLFSHQQQATSARKRWEAHEWCLWNTSSKPRVGLPKEGLLPLDGATYRRWWLPVCFYAIKTRHLFQNGWKWPQIVYQTLVVNQGRPVLRN